MSPEYRTTSLLGPLARDRFKKAGMVASLTLVMAAGVVSPAVAAAKNVSGHAALAGRQPAESRMSRNAGDYWMGRYSGDHDECKGEPEKPSKPNKPKSGLKASWAKGGNGGKDECRGATGPSQAGYWVPRALAFERRIAAAVADPGVTRVVDSWWHNLGPGLRGLWESGDRAAFDRVVESALAQDRALAATWRRRAKPYGIDSPYDLLAEVSRYDVMPVVDRITTPLLITDPDGEHFWPGASRELYEALTGPKHLVRFTEAEGAHRHCEPLGRALFEQRVFDWLDARLAADVGV